MILRVLVLRVLVLEVLILKSGVGMLLLWKRFVILRRRKRKKGRIMLADSGFIRHFAGRLGHEAGLAGRMAGRRLGTMSCAI